MAAGPLFPHSAYPVDAGMVFPNFHVGAGANSKHDEGLGVGDATTITADCTWRLRFKIPTTLPTGTLKLKGQSLANATTGDLKHNPKWASVAAEESPSGAALNAEGTQTITWGAGDNDQYKAWEVNLDADTPVAGETIVLDWVIENLNTTLAVTSTHQLWLEWT